MAVHWKCWKCPIWHWITLLGGRQHQVNREKDNVVDSKSKRRKIPIRNRKGHLFFPRKRKKKVLFKKIKVQNEDVFFVCLYLANDDDSHMSYWERRSRLWAEVKGRLKDEGFGHVLSRWTRPICLPCIGWWNLNWQRKLQKNIFDMIEYVLSC